MPHELFSDLVCPQVHERRTAYRPTLMVASVGAHLVALVLAVVTSILAPEILPSPLAAKADPFIIRAQMPVPVPPGTEKPKPEQTNTSVTTPGAQDIPLNQDPPKPGSSAPVEAPGGVKPDSFSQAEAAGPGGGRGLSTVSSTDGLVDGVAHFGTAAPPPPPPRQPVRLHSGMQAPRKTAHVAPTYPVIARDARVQGVVILEAVIDEEGAVTSARVLRSIPMLDEAALTAVRQWRFEPALLNGSPVPVVVTVTVNFHLE